MRAITSSSGFRPVATLGGVTLNLNSFAEGLEGSASFHTFLYEDYNPLRGQLKLRTLYNPNKDMRVIHDRLRKYLARITPPLPYATGARPNCSPLKNVLRHRKNRFFYLTDLASAYENVKAWRLAKVLVRLDPTLDYSETLTFLKRYCFSEEGGLNTGAPACPDLFNLYAGILLDEPLGRFCEERSLVMTRYLDDIAISSTERNGPIGKHKRKAIREIIAKAGFIASDHKTEVLDLKKGPIFINGVGLEFGGRTFLPRRYHRYLKGLIVRSRGDASITLSMLAGRMGVFWGTTGKKQSLNRTEAKLVRQFEIAKERLR